MRSSFLVMLEFRSKHKRDPEVKHLDEDREVLGTLRTEVMDRLKVSKDIVPENFTSKLYLPQEISSLSGVSLLVNFSIAIYLQRFAIQFQTLFCRIVSSVCCGGWRTWTGDNKGKNEDCLF